MTLSVERIGMCDWNLNLIKIVETVERKLEIQLKRLRSTTKQIAF